MFKIDDKVVCVNNVIFREDLTLYKQYKIKDIVKGLKIVYFAIVSDKNKLNYFDSERFVSFKVYRKMKLKRLSNEK